MPISRLDQIVEMLKSDPNDSFLNYALALEYAKEGKTEKAIESIEQLLARDKNYLGAYYQLGKFYEETDNVSAAINIYQKGIEIAREQKNRKAEGELNEALFMIED